MHDARLARAADAALFVVMKLCGKFITKAQNAASFLALCEALEGEMGVSRLAAANALEGAMRRMARTRP